MTATPLEPVARAICAERCAVYGEPPCHTLDDWDGTDCDHIEGGAHDVGCRTLAAAALAAMKMEG